MPLKRHQDSKCRQNPVRPNSKRHHLAVPEHPAAQRGSVLTFTALQWSRQSRCTYLEVPLHLQGAMKSRPAHAQPHNQSVRSPPPCHPAQNNQGATQKPKTKKVGKQQRPARVRRPGLRSLPPSPSVSRQIRHWSCSPPPPASRSISDGGGTSGDDAFSSIAARRSPSPSPRTTASAGASRASSAPRPSDPDP